MLNTENPQELLFHYTTMETAIESILPHFLYRMGRFSETNDPRENKPWTASAWGSGLGDDFFDLAVSARAELDKVYRNLRVICLTQDWNEKPNKPNEAPPEERGYGRSRMWAQYGQDHQGVCLVFHREALSAAVHKTTKNIPGQLFGEPVSYEVLSKTHEEHLYAGAYDLDLNSIQNLGRKKTLQRHIVEFADVLLFKKNLDWRDESEFRWVFSTEDQTEEIFVPIKVALVCVIVGIDFRPVYFPSLAQICGAEVPILQMGWHRGHFLHPKQVPKSKSSLYA